MTLLRKITIPASAVAAAVLIAVAVSMSATASAPPQPTPPAGAAVRVDAGQPQEIKVDCPGLAQVLSVTNVAGVKPDKTPAQLVAAVVSGGKAIDTAAVAAITARSTLKYETPQRKGFAVADETGRTIAAVHLADWGDGLVIEGAVTCAPSK